MKPQEQGLAVAACMNDETTAWCAGLPFAGEAELSAAEGDLLRAWHAAAQKSAFKLLLLVTVPILAFVVFLVWVMPLAAILSLFLVCVSPIFFIKAYQRWSAARRYARDLAAGRIWRFQGSVSQHEAGVVDEHHRKLVARGLMSNEPGSFQRMAVLPVSREVLFANGVPAPAGLRAEVAEVAPAPASSFRVALPEWVPTNKMAPVDVKRRRLNGNERAELQAKIGQLRRLSSGFWILTVLTGLVFWAWRHSGYPVPPQPITQLIPAGLWIYTAYEVAKNQLRAFRLSKDFALGWVVTVVPQDEPESGAEPDISREFLLTSRFAWTVDGVPAVWRGAKGFSTLLIDRRP